MDEYERRLRNNARNSAALDALLSEGRAALMFLRNGFQVTLRERPDLQIRLDEEVVYAEVKHFREKRQDTLDELAMLQATDTLVPIGDTTATEGKPAWRQVAQVALRKAGQYMYDAPNILVVESSSQSLELTAVSAVHEFDDEILKSNDPRLHRLNGIMLVDTRSVTFSPAGPWNVEFCQTFNAALPLSKRVSAALGGIHLQC